MELLRQNHTQPLHHKFCVHTGLQRYDAGGGEDQLYFIAAEIPAGPHWRALFPNHRIALCPLRVGSLATAPEYPARRHRVTVFPAPAYGSGFF